MKKISIDNKQTDLTIKLDSTEKARYSDIASLTLDTPPQGGFDVTTMKNRIDVKAVLDKANGKIELTEVQFDTLKGCVESHRFGAINQVFVDFVDAVLNAKK